MMYYTSRLLYNLIRNVSVYSYVEIDYNHELYHYLK